MQPWHVTLLFIVVAVIAAAAFRANGVGQAAAVFRRRPLLSGAEQRLFALLRAELAAPVVVLAQVRLADLIEPVARDAKVRHGAFRTISQKHVDFVLYDAQCNEVLLAIELDGPTHEGASRRKADATKAAALISAQVPFAKLGANDAKNAATVRRLIASHLPSSRVDVSGAVA